MKKLASILVAAGALGFAPQAVAQVVVHPGYGGGGYHHPGFGHHFNRGNFFGGFAFGGFFHQPQFHVQNWQLYGFVQPQQHQRWIRYYDDAYLVDRRGYVHDRRARVDWDRYGERWERDAQGIPYYVGDGDYYPDDRDYAEVDAERRWGGSWDYSGYGSACGQPQPCQGGYSSGHSDVRYETRRVYHDGHGGYSRPLPPPPSCGGGGYVCGGSGAYGYSGYGHGGYGHGGTVIVTETTIHPGQTVVTEEIIEEVVVEERPRRRQVPARRYVAPPKPRHHAPPSRVIHPRGDRG